MRTYRILQLGDIHYPDWLKVRPDIDLRDLALASTLVTAISDHPIRRILRAISERVANNSYDFAVLIGDITSKGDPTYFEPALRHFAYLLNIRSQKMRVGFVPGNHDVDRHLALTHGIEGKFLPLSEIASRFAWPTPPIGDVECVALPGSPPPALMMLLNTCLGCGERRFLPSTIRDAVDTALNKAMQEKDPSGKPTKAAEEALSEYYETLDTPAMHESALASLIAQLQSLSSSCLPVLVGHHNLLPQGVPRIALYAELVNAGRLRRSLLALDRPILYLHGHIHDDPVEVITSPPTPNSRLICISAPEITKGFNEIVIFTDRIGRPRGCRVERFRHSSSEGLTKLPPVDIPLTPTAVPINTRIAYEIVAEVTKERKAIWASVKQHLLKNGSQEQEADEAVQDVYFSGLLRLMNPDSPLNEWILTI